MKAFFFGLLSLTVFLGVTAAAEPVEKRDCLANWDNTCNLSGRNCCSGNCYMQSGWASG
ncbi:hypothetical protein DFQ29_004055, partial [Apophysomyces sp. BC1021]